MSWRSDPAALVSDEAYAAGYRDGRIDALREAADDVPLFEFMLVMDIASEVAPAQIASWLRARAEEVG